MSLLLVRHAKTISNIDRIYAGRSREPILKDGGDVLKRMVERISQEAPARLFASPLPRTCMTAQVIGRSIGLEVEYADELIEMDFGIWTGKKGDEIAREYPESWAAWRVTPFSTRPSCGESLAEVQYRTLSWIRRTHELCRNTVAVTHESVIKTVLCSISPEGNDYYRKVDVKNCSVQQIEMDELGALKSASQIFPP